MRKLVRDKIPEIAGKEAQVVRGQEYEKYIILKMAEEFEEFMENPSIEEAADLFTATLALVNSKGLCWPEIEREIIRKGQERGGFGAGLVMEVEG